MKTSSSDRVTASVPVSAASVAAGASREPLLVAARAWDRFWFAPADPTTLGLIRICAGLIVLYVQICYGFLLFSYVSPGAWMDNSVVEYMRYKAPLFIPGWDWDEPEVRFATGSYVWSIFFGVQNPATIVALHVGVVVASLLFLAGFATRITSVLAWVGALSYIHRSPITLFGMDTMLSIAMFYLMIGPSGAALSIDRWLQKRRARREGNGALAAAPEALVGANLATRLIQVHFCIIYLASGFSKLLGASWWMGTAPSRVLLNPEFAPFSVALYYHTIVFLAKHRMLWEIFMGAGVIFTFFTEIGFPFLVWNRHTRWLMVICSVLLHTNIALFMGLTSFSLMMMAMVLAFVPPEVVRQILNNLFQQAGQVFGTPPAGRGAPASQGKLVLTRN